MIYFGDFKSKKDVEENFDIELPGRQILIAVYEGQGSYDGSAFVLFKYKGKIYEVNASHCSCMGLEGQWEPEEVSVPALKIRKWGYFGSPDFQVALNSLLDSF